MTVTYGIIEEVYTLNEDRRLSYGLAAYADADQNGTSAVVASVHGITSDKERLLEQIEQYNLSGLSLIHLDDVIADFLAD